PAATLQSCATRRSSELREVVDGPRREDRRLLAADGQDPLADVTGVPVKEAGHDAGGHVAGRVGDGERGAFQDLDDFRSQFGGLINRKSTRLNSSHGSIS